MKKSLVGFLGLTSCFGTATFVVAQTQPLLTPAWRANTLVVLVDSTGSNLNYRCSGVIHGFGGGAQVDAPFDAYVTSGGSNRELASFTINGHGPFQSATISNQVCSQSN